MEEFAESLGSAKLNTTSACCGCDTQIHFGGVTLVILIGLVSSEVINKLLFYNVKLPSWEASPVSNALLLRQSPVAPVRPQLSSCSLGCLWVALLEGP